jgi:phosphatidylethanolamine-binding protein (PEBP) family uncharacterized protein
MRSTTSLAFMIGSTLMLAACGGGGGDDEGDDTGDDAPAVDAPPGAADGPEPDADLSDFVLTSPAFAEGGVIPVEHSCQGDDVSPELAWTGGPVALSYAVVLTDLNNDLIHSVIYDIPGAATGLPAAVDNAYAPADVPGAHQPLAWDNDTRGYLGPCPGSTHTYQFALFALDVATLPGTDEGTTRAEAVPLINEHSLGSTTLSGTFTPN